MQVLRQNDVAWASSEAIGILMFLLPGFLAAAIFYSLTSHPKPDAFGQIIQALIFTVIVQAAVQVMVAILPHTKNWKLVASVLIAVISALIAVYFSNNDKIHSILRWFHVTKETSYPSEWYSAFSRHSDCYVVLHLKEGRRLYGWPEEWPSDPDHGHFRVAEGEWLVGNERKPATGVSAILIPANEVEMVEFLKHQP